MSLLPYYTARPRPKLWLVLGLLLLAQLATLATGHEDHGLEPSLRRSADALVFPQACHPREDSHLEAAGPGHPAHPCTLCLHLTRSVGVQRPSAPRLAPPVRSQAPGASAASLLSCETLCSFGSRAPPFA
ncbi:MAG TPA: hypothetical protein VIC28_06595 [Thermoanaerobaculia bacterium]|jgi:hypothetical protein